MIEKERVDRRSRHSGKRTRAIRMLAGLAALYLLTAYLLMPFAWERYARYKPPTDDDPRVTTTGDGHPGDPLNVSLIGTADQIDALMQAANWYPAAALGLASDLRIAVDTVLSRPDDEAPVSNLYLFGRREDLAFEKPMGDSPRKRHHVRFWKTAKVNAEGAPIWTGSATYDERVGLSHTTGQITHHIAADVDTERDHLFADLKATGQLADVYVVKGFHRILSGRNGGGDPWYTDGNLAVGVIK